MFYSKPGTNTSQCVHPNQNITLRRLRLRPNTLRIRLLFDVIYRELEKSWKRQRFQSLYTALDTNDIHFFFFADCVHLFKDLPNILNWIKDFPESLTDDITSKNISSCTVSYTALICTFKKQFWLQIPFNSSKFFLKTPRNCVASIQLFPGCAARSKDV